MLIVDQLIDVDGMLIDGKKVDFFVFRWHHPLMYSKVWPVSRFVRIISFHSQKKIHINTSKIRFVDQFKTTQGKTEDKCHLILAS